MADLNNDHRASPQRSCLAWPRTEVRGSPGLKPGAGRDLGVGKPGCARLRRARQATKRTQLDRPAPRHTGMDTRREPGSDHGAARARKLHQRHSHVLLLAHVVWSTRDREAVLEPNSDEWLATVLSHKAAELSSRLLAIGATVDHVHIVARYPSTLCLADLVQRLKGASAHACNRVTPPSTRPLRWQVGYWAESVPPTGLNRLLLYVAHQREHHADGNLRVAWEAPPSLCRRSQSGEAGLTHPQPATGPGLQPGVAPDFQSGAEPEQSPRTF